MYTVSRSALQASLEMGESADTEMARRHSAPDPILPEEIFLVASWVCFLVGKVFILLHFV